MGTREYRAQRNTLAAMTQRALSYLLGRRRRLPTVGEALRVALLRIDRRAIGADPAPGGPVLALAAMNGDELAAIAGGGELAAFERDQARRGPRPGLMAAHARVCARELALIGGAASLVESDGRDVKSDRRAEIGVGAAAKKSNARAGAAGAGETRATPPAPRPKGMTWPRAAAAAAGER